MPNVMLTWAQAAWVGVGLWAAAFVLSRTRARPAPFAREAGVIAFLYALWQLANTLSHGSGSADAAFARARWIERAEAAWHLPSEAAVQRPLLDHHWLGQFANLYYATMHFTMLFVLLLWVFTRHRDAYGRMRTALIGFTFIALLVQLVPVAPPRLLPGFTDVAARYGQSVYDVGGVTVDELSAMPSVHVGWAVLVAGTVLWLGSGPGRWLGVVHAALTIWVVVATGNHWWLDGLGAVAILAAVVGLQLLWSRRNFVTRSALSAHGVTKSARSTQRDPDDAVV